jgi:hypothetical protein
MTFPRISETATLTRTIVVMAMLGAGLAACSAPGALTSPTAPSALAGSDGFNATSSAAAVAAGANLAGDAAFAPVDPTLISTCAGTLSKNGTSVTWARFTECVVITPNGSSYALTNDPSLQVTTKRGVITHVTLYIDDVVGEEGIQHETDPIPVTPVAFGEAGFVLHVHADRVPVYRLSGHLGGKRVATIGTISIADVVYF